jgi:hypothetical protein
MFTSKSTLASISKRSASIVDVFTQTKNDCLALNQEIDGLVQKKNEEITNLNSEVAQLTSISANHTKLANKIDSFLNS